MGAPRSNVLGIFGDSIHRAETLIKNLNLLEGSTRLVKNAHRSKTVKAPDTINRMIELEKTSGGICRSDSPAKFDLAKRYKSMVCREVVKLLDASFTFLERWARITRKQQGNRRGRTHLEKVWSHHYSASVENDRYSADGCAPSPVPLPGSQMVAAMYRSRSGASLK